MIIVPAASQADSSIVHTLQVCNNIPRGIAGSA